MTSSIIRRYASGQSSCVPQWRTEKCTSVVKCGALVESAPNAQITFDLITRRFDAFAKRNGLV